MNRPDRAQMPIPWWQGWAPLLLLPGGVALLAPPAWPRWAFMWTLAGSIYVGCKWLTWRRTPTQGVPYWKHAGYLLAWPGLDAAAFLTGRSTNAPRRREWAFGAAKFAFGVVLFLGATKVGSLQQPYLVGWIGMIGIVLMLHFGLFHLLSCAWRRIGVDARPLMDWPLKSISLSEFWGRRWNTAFRDLTHRFLFRPLTPWIGPRGAIFGGFVFSGIVHDVVISMPSRGGYGGPTLFFTIQAAGMLVERTALGKRLGLGRGWSGWGFTLVVLLAPVYWLFHPPFVEHIVVPFMNAVAEGL
jgi:alginate O-acetyltransferase complex protein AlgI